MFQNITHHKNILQAFRYQLKSTLDKGLAFAKTIPALVNLWVISMIEQTFKSKDELMLMKLPKK
jgi:hypothetical protein